jgi:DNA-binding MarR family transcriptional regulator
MTLQQLGPHVQARLSQITHIDRATMVSLLNNLEAQSFIERCPHPTDKRAHHVQITAHGEDLITRATAVTQRATDQFLAVLTEGERAQLLDMLVRVAESVTPHDYQVGQPLFVDDDPA